jgi:hypothetical protein
VFSLQFVALEQGFDIASNKARLLKGQLRRAGESRRSVLEESDVSQREDFLVRK